MKRIISACLIAVLAVLICGCTANEHSSGFFAMNTYMNITAYGKNAQNAVREAQSEVTRLDKLWSVTDENSEIYMLNKLKYATVSDDTAKLISFAKNISLSTSGTFDATIYPVLSAWGFTTDAFKVPEKEEINKLLHSVGWEKVSLTDHKVTLSDNAMLDFGGIAKGAAADKVADILRENGITSALVNLGGSITVIGKNQQKNDWQIGVQSPFGEDYVGILSLSDASAVTSGAYERSFTATDGTVYGHIIDPSTGIPVDNTLASVTIISQNATLCDALSTALFVMGQEKAVQFYEENGSTMGFDVLLITKEKEVLSSRGTADKFKLTDKSYTTTVI